MSCGEDLRAAIDGYDGRSQSILSEAAARFGTAADYLDALVALAADQDGRVSDGATWMLKAALEDRRKLAAGQVMALVDRLDGLATWQARLHVCQIIGYLDIPIECAARLRDWLAPVLAHDRPFLRAWALDALCRLPDAENHGQREALLDRMAEDPAASVRARVRRLRKERAFQPK